MIARLLQWIVDFLRDGESGNASSSRLISVGSASIMGIYIFADAGLRFLASILALYWGDPIPANLGMNESGLLAAFAGLVTLSTAAYGVNKWASVKKAEGGPDAPEQGGA